MSEVLARSRIPFVTLRPRHFLLPTAALVLVGLCAWKSMRTYDDASAADLVTLMPAPRFVERDDAFWPVKLSRYLTRHRIVVAFFDGETGADDSPLLQRLKAENAELERRGWVVIAIGDATPIENRQTVRSAGGYPFPVLADVDDEMQVDLDTIRAWGRWDEQRSRVRPGIVLVDRAGFVKSRNGRPVAEPDFDAALDEILERAS